MSAEGWGTHTADPRSHTPVDRGWNTYSQHISSEAVE